jgi:hypothetical protein
MPGARAVVGRRRVRRPRTWRWLVVLRDLPPMPPRAEVVTGFLTRRSAEYECRMLRVAHSQHIAEGLVDIDVRRG